VRHAWQRVRRYPGYRWRCRRCGRLFAVRTWRECNQRLLPYPMPQPGTTSQLAALAW
jgi:hypothetical protein